MGDINLNTITPDISTGSWQGTYFTDYPIKVTAIPKDGYEFVGWEGASNSTENQITVSFSNDITLKAIFKQK